MISVSDICFKVQKCTFFQICEVEYEPYEVTQVASDMASQGVKVYCS